MESDLSVNNKLYIPVLTSLPHLSDLAGHYYIDHSDSSLTSLSVKLVVKRLLPPEHPGQFPWISNSKVSSNHTICFSTPCSTSLVLNIKQPSSVLCQYNFSRLIKCHFYNLSHISGVGKVFL